jgi:hypothetical protein
MIIRILFDRTVAVKTVEFVDGQPKQSIANLHAMQIDLQPDALPRAVLHLIDHREKSRHVIKTIVCGGEVTKFGDNFIDVFADMREIQAPPWHKPQFGIWVAPEPVPVSPQNAGEKKSEMTP